MLHKTLEAKATTLTDQGEFVALAAAYSTDRGNERIVPGAFQGTIEKWQASGKQIPVHWDHEGSPESIIGVVDPMAMKETDAGLLVSGKLDLENSDVAKEAWRAMKSNALGLSFGYMVRDGAEAKDGVYELKEIDLFEISVTPAPMNADTKFLSLKSAREELGLAPLEEDVVRLRKQTERDETWNSDLVAIHGAIARRRKALDEIEQAVLALEKKAAAEEPPEPSEDVPAEGTQPEAATDQAVEDGTDEEPPGAKSTPQDPLKQASRDAMLELMSDGMSLHKYVEPPQEPPPEVPSEDSQRRRYCDLYLT